MASDGETTTLDAYVEDILHAMCLEGWAEDQIGDTNDSFYVWRLSTDISDDNKELRAILLSRGIPVTDDLISILRGHFIVSVSKKGLVLVTRQATYEESKARFDEIEMIYLSWQQENGGDGSSQERLNRIGAMSESAYRKFRDSYRNLSAISYVIAFQVSNGIEPSSEILAQWKEADTAHTALCSQLVVG